MPASSLSFVLSQLIGLIVGGSRFTKHSSHKIGIISSCSLTPEEVITRKRLHWSVENKLHHVLDVSLLKDMSSSRKGKWNLSLVRKIVINLIRLCVIYGFVDNMNSIPCEAIKLAGDTDLLRKMIFENLQMIRMDK